MKILIVDDDAASNFALELSLKRLGHEVKKAAGGAEALQIFEHWSPAILISDLLMPGMDGLELCRRVRAAGHPTYTYLILLTLVAGKSGYLSGMDAGADDFITKPFDEEMLAARLVVAGRILRLQTEVKQLSGLLPICALCKKVRDDRNYWHQVEAFLSSHTDARLTHSYCPDCFQKLLKEVEAIVPDQQS